MAVCPAPTALTEAFYSVLFVMFSKLISTGQAYLTTQLLNCYYGQWQCDKKPQYPKDNLDYISGCQSTRLRTYWHDRCKGRYLSLIVCSRYGSRTRHGLSK